MKKMGWGAVATAAVLLAGCGSASGVSVDGMAEVMKSEGVSPAQDAAQLLRDAKTLCGLPEDEFNDIAVDAAKPGVEGEQVALRAGVKYVCRDRLKQWDLTVTVKREFDKASRS